MAFRKDTSSKRTIRRRLGRGLDSLVAVAMPSDVALDEPYGAADGLSPQPPPPDSGSLRMLNIDHLATNPRQPRQRFDEQGLQIGRRDRDEILSVEVCE